jgi:hypothetical protein
MGQIESDRGDQTLSIVSHNDPIGGRMRHKKGSAWVLRSNPRLGLAKWLLHHVESLPNASVKAKTG